MKIASPPMWQPKGKQTKKNVSRLWRQSCLLLLLNAEGILWCGMNKTSEHLVYFHPSTVTRSLHNWILSGPFEAVHLIEPLAVCWRMICFHTDSEFSPTGAPQDHIRGWCRGDNPTRGERVDCLHHLPLLLESLELFMFVSARCLGSVSVWEVAHPNQQPFNLDD